MSPLPRRFPKQNLFTAAANFELRLERLIEDVDEKMSEADDRGMHLVLEKLRDRRGYLETARHYAGELADTLYCCP